MSFVDEPGDDAAQTGLDVLYYALRWHRTIAVKPDE